MTHGAHTPLTRPVPSIHKPHCSDRRPRTGAGQAMPATLTRRHMEPLEQAGSRYAELMRLARQACRADHHQKALFSLSAEQPTSSKPSPTPPCDQSPAAMREPVNGTVLRAGNSVR